MSGMWAAITAAIALLVFWLFFTQRLRESEQIRDALVSAVHECRAEIARLRLTDAEREALERNLKHANGRWLMHVSEQDQATIGGLLERTK